MILRVRFAETDAMGVAHHGAYAPWLEAARVEWMRERGLRYRDLEAEGISMAVAHLDVRYRRAAHFDDELRIDTTLTTLRSRFATFAYRIVVADGEDADAPVATATTAHVPTDRTGRAVRVPRAWHDALRGHVQPPT
ncbi:MAG: thioesterase family protein [Trueperaceae bacterium]|nr:thioesterase family protein [Trueperaceae bacterium]